MSEKKIPENDSFSEETVSAPVGDLLKYVISAEGEPGDIDWKDNGGEKNKKLSKKTEGKKLKHGLMSTILTIVFVAVVVLVNIVATVLFDRYPITIDLTDEKIYSISEESEEYVKNIDVDTLITVFSDEEAFTGLSTYTKQAAEVMKKYTQYNSRITYRYVDIDSNPDIMADYQANSVSQFDIIVETNPTEDVKRTRKITLMDLVDFKDEFVEQMSNTYGTTLEAMAEQYGDLTVLSYYGGYVEASTADQAFVSAFMTVTDPNPVTVTMLTGRNESSKLAYFQKLLEANGYTVKTVDITKEELPLETTVAVIPAPQTDYLDAEIEKVDKFLDNEGELGKELLYLASASQGKTPNLDEFLKEYGIGIGEGVICETSSDYYYQIPAMTVTNEISDNFNQDMTTSEPVILNYYSRPVKLLFDEEGQIATEAYIKSTVNGYTIDMESGEILEKGQQVYAAVASKALFLTDGGTNYSNVIVFGSADALSDVYLSYSQFQNREYIISLLNGITHKTDGIYIEPKVIEGNVFDITDKQKSVLKWTFILVIPAAVLITGLIIWVRRKNR